MYLTPCLLSLFCATLKTTEETKEKILLHILVCVGDAMLLFTVHTLITQLFLPEESLRPRQVGQPGLLGVTVKDSITVGGPFSV